MVSAVSTVYMLVCTCTGCCQCQQAMFLQPNHACSHAMLILKSLCNAPQVAEGRAVWAHDMPRHEALHVCTSLEEHNDSRPDGPGAGLANDRMEAEAVATHDKVTMQLLLSCLVGGSLILCSLPFSLWHGSWFMCPMLRHARHERGQLFASLWYAC